LFEKS
jgi:hypothetical protein